MAEPNYREKLIKDCDFPVDIINILRRTPIKTLGDLLEKSEKELLKLEGVTYKILREIDKALDEYGEKLKK